MINLKEAIDLLKYTSSEFVKVCRIVNYQASGPGGQKRNRKLSAVRLIHIQSKITVTASDFRETNRNLINAIAKLRLEIALKSQMSDSENIFESLKQIDFEENINGKKHNFALSVLKVFCYFRYNSGSIRETAEVLQISSSKLIKFFKKNKQVWQETQEVRKKFGHTLLK